MSSNELIAEVEDSLSTKVRKVSGLQRLIKAVFILGGSLIAGVSTVFIGVGGQGLSAAHLATLGGVVFAFFGGIFGLIAEEDPVEQIDKARRAAIKAERHEDLARRQHELLVKIEQASDQLKNLYAALSTCRGTIEQAVTVSNADENRVIDECLRGTRYNFINALGFRTSDYWTLLVYKCEKDPAAPLPQLRCISQLRAVECLIENARVWSHGVGIVGVAFAKNEEVVVPDVATNDAGNAFIVKDGVSKPTDAKHYRSMFAVPISVGQHDDPWGVVVATSSSPNHFGNEKSQGVRSEEAVRALAGIVALGVAVCRTHKVVNNNKAVAEKKE